jgi:hypothetical protein
MRVAEFFGLPGAGKSTLHRVILDADRALYPGPKAPADHQSGNAYFRDFVRSAYSGPRVVPSRCVKEPRTVLRRTDHHEVARAKKGFAWCVYHEHLSQSGLSLALALPNDPDIVAAYYRSMPLPDMSILLCVPRALAVERFSNRTRGWRWTAGLDLLERAIETAAATIATRGGRLVILDGAKSIEENQRLIYPEFYK